MIRHEIRKFMADIGIDGALWEERLMKLEEEIGELMEAVCDSHSTIDDVLSEYADVGIVALTMVEKARQMVERLGFNFDSLMIEKMDATRRKYNTGRTSDDITSEERTGDATNGKDFHERTAGHPDR